MADAPVRTWVRGRGAWTPFQEFMIRDRAAGPVEDVAFRGAEAARAHAGGAGGDRRRARGGVGPSNPVISIGPILAVPGMREALRACLGAGRRGLPARRRAVLKGPTDAFMAWAGEPLSSDGIAARYDGLLDGLVADERTDALPTLETDVAMPDAAGRRRRRARRRSASRWRSPA